MVGRHKQILPVIIVQKNRCLKFINEHAVGDWWTEDAKKETKRLLRKIGNIDRIDKMTGKNNVWTEMMALINPLVILDTYFFKWDRREFELRFPGIVEYIQTIRVMDDKQWEAVRRPGLEQQILYNFTKLAAGTDRVEGQVRMKKYTNNPNVFEPLNRVIRKFDPAKYPTKQSLTATGGLVCGIRFVPYTNANDRRRKGKEERNLQELLSIDPAVIDAWPVDDDDDETVDDETVDDDDGEQQSNNRTPNGTPNGSPNRTPNSTPNSTPNRTPNRNRYSLSVSPGKVFSRLKEGIKNTVSGCRSGAGNVLSAQRIRNSNILSSSDSSRDSLDPIALAREYGAVYRVGNTNTQTTNSVVVAASSQYERVRLDFHSTIDQVPTAAAIGTPSPVRRISNHNESSANNNNNSSGSGRGTGNDNQQEQLTDDSNIVQVPAAAATPAASNNGPTLVENADGDDTISEDLVNRTQNSPTASTNEQETEGIHSGDDSNIDQVPAVAATTRAIKYCLARNAYDLDREIADLTENLNREKSDLAKTNIQLNTTIQEKKAEVSNLTDRVASLQDEKRASTEQHAAAIDALRAEFEASEAVLRAEIIDRNDTIHQREATIRLSTADLARREETIRQHNNTIRQRNVSIRQNTADIARREETIRQNEATIGQHEATIRQSTADFARREEHIRERNDSIETLKGEKTSLRGTIRNLRDDVSTLEQTIRENAVRHEEETRAMISRFAGLAETEHQQLARNSNNNNNGDNRNNNV